MPVGDDEALCLLYGKVEQRMKVFFLRGVGLACVVLATVTVAFAQVPQLAFTWDDLPAHSVLPQGETRVDIGRKIIAAMQAAHMPPVYGFVNGSFLQNEPLSAPMLTEWRKAGLMLGNHTWSHMDLNQSSVAAWEADVLKNEPVLEKYANGIDWHWLRFPFLSEGDTPEKRDAIRAFLAAHGYKIADVTMDFGDYMYNEPYARCVAMKDDAAIKQLEESYLKIADQAIDNSLAIAISEYGREIPYVLLMHVGAFDARMLPRLIALYKSRGFEFITLEEAEKDPVYASDIEPSLPAPKLLYYPPMPPDPPQPDVDLDAICK
jgi:peptidoglycan-N-acetylglucosamine deacetylase